MKDHRSYIPAQLKHLNSVPIASSASAIRSSTQSHSTEYSGCTQESHQWHLKLDLIITRRAQLKSVLTPRSYRSADCDTDYSLVPSKVRLIPKKYHHSRRSGSPRINTARLSDLELRTQFANSVKKSLE